MAKVKLKKEKWMICSRRKKAQRLSMLDEAMKMKDKGRAMTKAEAANVIIQNARKALKN